VNEVIEVVSENAPFPMLVTLAGMVTEVRAVDANARSPMLVTLAGMVTEVRAVAYANMDPSMDVTLDKLVTEISDFAP
jgi:hypothetical protein